MRAHDFGHLRDRHDPPRRPDHMRKRDQLDARRQCVSDHLCRIVRVRDRHDDHLNAAPLTHNLQWHRQPRMLEVADHDLIARLPIDATHNEVESIAGAMTQRNFGGRCIDDTPQGTAGIRFDLRLLGIAIVADATLRPDTLDVRVHRIAHRKGKRTVRTGVEVDVVGDGRHRGANRCEFEHVGSVRPLPG